jgi:hypothetical protein
VVQQDIYLDNVYVIHRNDPRIVSCVIVTNSGNVVKEGYTVRCDINRNGGAKANEGRMHLSLMLGYK